MLSSFNHLKITNISNRRTQFVKVCMQMFFFYIETYHEPQTWHISLRFSPFTNDAAVNNNLKNVRL